VVGTVGFWAAGLAVIATATVLVMWDTRALAVVVAVFIACLIADKPRLALTFWVATLAFVPFWLTIPVGPVQLPPATIAALIALPAAVRARTRFARGDWLILAALAATVGAVFLAGSPLYLLSTLVVQGLTAYLIGRRLVTRTGPEWAISLIARIVIACAIWSIIEALFGIHLFEKLVGSSDLTFWAQIQTRGAFDRSEAAWGHAIALGAWFSLGLPFVFSAKLKHPVFWCLVVLLAALATFSRGPILGCLLATIACVTFLRTEKSSRRTALGISLMIATMIVGPVALQFIGAVSGELDRSSKYRLNLLAHAAEDIHLVGRADHVISTPEQRLIYRGFKSIDNAFLLMAVDAGALVAGLLALGLLVATFRVLSRKGTPADVALASQIVILGTVAMITQYQAAIFFVAGVAVTLASETSDSSPIRGHDYPKSAGDRRLLTVNQPRFTASGVAFRGPRALR
jgi:hypothetical protein